MSYPDRESIYSNHHVPTGNSLNGGALPLPAPPQPTDSAIDAALRSVPLPDGLLTRLDLMLASMSDEPADHVDWLGC